MVGIVPFARSVNESRVSLADRHLCYFPTLYTPAPEAGHHSTQKEREKERKGFLIRLTKRLPSLATSPWQGQQARKPIGSSSLLE